MVAKSAVSMHTAKIGPASPDMMAGAHNFQRSSRRLIFATMRPPASARDPEQSFEGAGISSDLSAAEMMHARQKWRDPCRGGVVGVGRQAKAGENDDKARLGRKKA